MITNLETLRQQLTAVNDEIRVVTPFQAHSYQAGLVAFQPRQEEDKKWIRHADAEVISYVLEGKGQLRLADEVVRLSPGVICHIPVEIPHDFVADHGSPLLMFFMTVKVQTGSDNLSNRS